MNTDAPWPSLDEAEARVLGIQTKLHRWANPRPSAPVESRVRGNAHARFGGRAGETDPPQGGHRAPARPYTLAWLLGCSRLGVRYERRTDVLLGLLHLACALICLQSLPES